MISPQKFSKTLGVSKLKIGISFKELFITSCLPVGLNFYDIAPFISLMVFVGVVVLLVIKNKLFEPAYLQNKLERQTHIKWEKVIIND